MSEQVRGHIKKILTAEGFAFIGVAGEREDYFLHRSGLQLSTKAWADVEKDDIVEFTPIEGERGRKRAIEVRVVS